jgi:hypothetical protein
MLTAMHGPYCKSWNLGGQAQNNISWTTIYGRDQLRGRLQPPYTDSRALAPPFQIWNLVIHIFDVAREKYYSHPNMKYILRLGFGVSGDPYRLGIY